MIETKRLKIYPASLDQMRTMISAENNDELRTAYKEMLEGCLTYPDQREWYALWIVELKDGTSVGNLCFKGLRNGCIMFICDIRAIMTNCIFGII